MSNKSKRFGNGFSNSTGKLTVPPPVVTRLQELPFDKITWDNFQRLCINLAKREAFVSECREYGLPGQMQHGIDLFARRSEPPGYIVYQCKRVENFSPSDITDAVDKFIKGKWFNIADTFVLCITINLTSKKSADTLVRAVDQFRSTGKTFIVWDYDNLCGRLKNHPDLLEDFFGEDWLEPFLGSNARNLVDSARQMYNYQLPIPRYITNKIKETAKNLEKKYKQLALAEENHINVIESEILELRRELRDGIPDQPGIQLKEGRYELVRRIGAGSYATVWEANDKDQGQTVALKILHSHLVHERSSVERFKRGAKTMQNLIHAHVVPVYDMGIDDLNRPFYTMELMEFNLENILSKREHSLREILNSFREIVHAVAYAHQKGFIHRDIKPGNILVKKNKFYLSDFDLVFDKTTTGGTQNGMGTFLYASPQQQFNASDIDERDDIYALGITLLTVCYGRSLSVFEIRYIEDLINELKVSKKLIEIIKRSTFWDRYERFKNAGEMLESLDLILKTNLLEHRSISFDYFVPKIKPSKSFVKSMMKSIIYGNDSKILCRNLETQKEEQIGQLEGAISSIIQDERGSLLISARSAGSSRDQREQFWTWALNEQSPVPFDPYHYVPGNTVNREERLSENFFVSYAIKRHPCHAVIPIYVCHPDIDMSGSTYIHQFICPFSKSIIENDHGVQKIAVPELPVSLGRWRGKLQMSLLYADSERRPNGIEIQTSDGPIVIDFKTMAELNYNSKLDWHPFEWADNISAIRVSERRYLIIGSSQGTSGRNVTLVLVNDKKEFKIIGEFEADRDDSFLWQFAEPFWTPDQAYLVYHPPERKNCWIFDSLDGIYHEFESTQITPPVYNVGDIGW